jgi:hypothetical protein
MCTELSGAAPPQAIAAALEDFRTEKTPPVRRPAFAQVRRS